MSQLLLHSADQQCEQHTHLRVSYVDSYQTFRPVVCPWCQIDRLRFVLRLVHDETRDLMRPYSFDSYLPPHIREQIAAALGDAADVEVKSKVGMTATIESQQLLDSAIERLREIAALAGTTKRKQAGCEIATSWLYAHGYALEEGGYIPGVGFESQES